MGRLAGKCCLISGGSKGLGAAQARLFAREGARVAVGDILESDGGRLVDELRTSGADSVFLRLDVTSEADWEGAVGAVMCELGTLDVLVNNAGIYNRALVEDTTLEEWERVMSVNSTGVFLGTKHAIPAMRRSGGGSIVNMSSVAGLVGSRTQTVYNASKGAVRLLTKSTAVQYAADGIRANSVHPGRHRDRHDEGSGAQRRTSGLRGCHSLPSADSAPPRTWRTASCSSPPTRPATSRARNW